MVSALMTRAKTTGGIVLGGLTATFVTLSTPVEFQLGEQALKLQADVLDKLLIDLLPLAITLLTLYLLNRKMKSTTVLCIIAIIAIISSVGAALGFF